MNRGSVREPGIAGGRGLDGRRRGFSLLEILLGAGLFVLIGIVIQRFWIASRRQEQVMGDHVMMQVQARRGFTRLLREIQEALGVVLPPDGYTKPYLVLRDQRDRMAFYYQVLDEATTEAEGRPIYRLMKRFAPHGGSGVPETPVELFGHIGRLTFSASGSGGVGVNLAIVSARREYPILTMIRLRALDTLERL